MLARAMRLHPVSPPVAAGQIVYFAQGMAFGGDVRWHRCRRGRLWPKRPRLVAGVVHSSAAGWATVAVKGWGWVITNAEV